jgi:hypothetical protein
MECGRNLTPTLRPNVTLLGKPEAQDTEQVENYSPAIETRFRKNRDDLSCRTCGARVMPRHILQHDKYHRYRREDKEEVDDLFTNHADEIDHLLSELEKIKRWIQMPDETETEANGP